MVEKWQKRDGKVFPGMVEVANLVLLVYQIVVQLVCKSANLFAVRRRYPRVYSWSSLFHTPDTRYFQTNSCHALSTRSSVSR